MWSLYAGVFRAGLCLYMFPNMKQRFYDHDDIFNVVPAIWDPPLKIPRFCLATNKLFLNTVLAHHSLYALDEKIFLLLKILWTFLRLCVFSKKLWQQRRHS